MIHECVANGLPRGQRFDVFGLNLPDEYDEMAHKQLDYRQKGAVTQRAISTSYSPVVRYWQSQYVAASLKLPPTIDLLSGIPIDKYEIGLSF